MDKEIIKLGNIYGFDGGNYAGNVYESMGIAPTLSTFRGGTSNL